MVCPPVYPLRILGRKWSYFILRALREPKSFSSLQRELKFVTNHILTRELRLLESEGLISHEKEYKLTPAGKELYVAIAQLEKWTVRHANCSSCPQDKRCSTCPGYTAVVGREK
jgi:DNA-binding HxlR family transcriptional regulator